VLVSFFGDLGLGQVAPREVAEGSKVHVDSLDVTKKSYMVILVPGTNSCGASQP
jgi:hypothetical protein